MKPKLAAAVVPDRPSATPQEAAERSLISAMAVNALVSLDRSQILAAAGRLAARAVMDPGLLSRRTLGLARELVDIVLGRSERGPEPGDKRFGDPAFERHPGYRRVMQTYLAIRAALHRLVDEVDLDPKSRDRARFALSLLTEALAPTNTLLGNPAAIKRAFDTAGTSLTTGLRNMVADYVENDGMPSQVDRRPFKVGENLAVTPGQVVFRNDVLELLQYAAATPEVYERPFLFIPPQVNKYYVFDLGPGRSLLEFAVKGGFTTFTVSWRNPTPAQRDWGLGTYVTALIEASDAVAEITGAEKINVMGACAGGITTAVFLAHLAAHGDDRFSSAAFPVTMIDMGDPGVIGIFTSEASIASSLRRSAEKGILSGSDLSRVFAWLRPNDLVWNYWINNYLMGDPPPAFDILYWNNDSTNLPATLHAEFLDIFLKNSLTKAGAVTVLDTPIDLKKVTCDVYAIGALTDHLTPWNACYRTPKLLGGKATFVASNSGHIQALVNPPGNLKARYLTNPDLSGTATEWLEGAKEQKGSWWTHWADWLTKRSAGKRPAPAVLGSAKHRPIIPAPGRYVHQKHK
ncbi:MAG TPA: alpha/beta fold hydrolase [Candidatus Binatia bacterium]|nr:alpha/beta fold hydrolase [Candidatus Binatia bacterium]